MTQESFYEIDENIKNEWKRKFFEEMRLRHSTTVKRGMALRAEAGYHIHRIPVGYRRVWKDNTFLIEPDPIQSVHVHQAFQLMATGKYSLRKLLAIMTERGLRTTSGKPMTVASFHGMLSNPFYIGIVRNGTSLLPGVHTAIITNSTLERTQDALCSNRRNRKG